MNVLSFQSEEAKEILKKGSVLALPTETVYGLAVRWDDEKAYKRLCEAKRRSPEKPIAVMVGTKFDLSEYFEITPETKKVMDHFLPGPLTCLVKAKKNAPMQSHLGTYVAGIRIPKKKELLDFIDGLGFPLQVTSANISGEKATSSFAEVFSTFENVSSVEAIIKGECDSGTPTSVVSFVGDKPVLIRQGEITKEEIEDVYFGR